ncbi:MAG: hypothetical protein WC817_05160 [Patescibacteria group bacterium]|jgi:hypothetical protein
MKSNQQTTRRPRQERPLLSLGDVFAEQLTLASARALAKVRRTSSCGRLEEVARQVGADLCNPEEFRVCEELVAGR